MIDDILKKALILDGNDTNYLTTDSYLYFQYLLIELSKIKYNIRFCSNNKCECHPETAIKQLLENEQLVSFLKEYKLFSAIKTLINDYKPITIYD